MVERSEWDYPLSHESWARSRALYGEDHLLEQDVLRALDPDFADLYLRFSHEHLNARGVLSQKTRELCAVSALTLIEKPCQLSTHVKAAIRAGASREEALEAIFQMVVYAGLPTVVEAVHVYNRAIAELAAAEPESAAAQTPHPPRFAEDGLSFHERSLPTKARLYGSADAYTTQEEFDAADPALGQAYEELVVGGMYSRTVVDPKTRQLLAIAACMVKNALPQLDAHVKMGFRVGVTPDEVREVIIQMSAYTGFPFMLQAWRRFADTGQAILESVKPAGGEKAT